MHAEYATFGLAPAMRAGGILPSGAYQAHREFLDFIVDGRPLLLRLDDVDAVSPLAADLGPTVFTAHVQRLLLEAEPPLDGGRYVLYGCPECEGLDCGAVTAVIEREDDAIIWRDFAWQTDGTADLERNGYPGIGPFRFHVEQYRDELERVIADGAAEAPTRRVLLVGARAAVLARLAKALRQIGISAEISRDAALASAEELNSYGAVAIGSSIGAEEQAAVRAAFAAAGSDATIVDGLAPIVPVLVAQIEAALDRSAYGQRQLTALDASGGTATLTVGTPCRVQLTAYRVDRLNRTHTYDLLDTQLTAGEHHIDLPPRAAHVVARTTSCVLVTPVG
ncbi:oxidoreductase [Streptomyces iconiensis]|uniref:Oxidoreductase n=1 Tax=Streptomyces iconiensis TaxID=1384038 RepID=A0ABT6ZPU0_9ACTN|nr:oxidoreductase [Streptomyces iconiensis]MDJ1131074.1 oxidoreductase [Streptomyces iconiensis]